MAGVAVNGALSAPGTTGTPAACVGPVAAPAAPLAGLSVSYEDLLRESHRRNFYAFFVYFWPELEPTAPYIEAPHSKVLCEHLQAVYEGRIPKLGIEIGPGYGKSFIAAVAFPAWVWACRDAGLRFGFSTYADDLTTRDSGRCRELMQSPRYQALYGHVFKLIKTREDYLRNDKGGYRVALAVAGKATGFRFNVWIGDDLLNAPDAKSDVKREPFKTHLRAIATRGQVGKPYYRVIIGQRLHEDDPGAYARKHGFEVLCLPSEYDPARHCRTSIGFSDWRTEPGQLLFPAGMGPAKIEEAKQEMGPDYSAQHQQLPVPAGGGIIKEEYLQLLDEAPLCALNYISVDTAQGERESNDSYGLSVHGLFNKGIVFRDGWTGQLRSPAFIEHLKSFCRRHNPSFVIIEQKDWGKALAQMLEDDPTFTWRIVRYTPLVSKTLRGHEALPLFYKNRYFMVKSPVADVAKSQLLVFPASKSRDLADSIIQAVIHAQSSFKFDSAVFEYVSSSTVAKQANKRSRNEHFGDPI